MGNNKFHAKKVTIGEHTFDSKKEADRYVELLKLLEKGEIKDLELQKKYILLPKQTMEYEEITKTGKVKKKEMTIQRETSYVCDFYYKTKDGEEVIEDVKGMRRGAAWQVYCLKKKMLFYFYGIMIKEI